MSTYRRSPANAPRSTRNGNLYNVSRNSNTSITGAYRGQLEGIKQKSNGKWVNVGKDGEHGEFKTKKAARQQQKAMFANGWHEDLNEDEVLDDENVNEGIYWWKKPDDADEDDMLGAYFSVTLDTPIKDWYATITDHNQYSDYVPDITFGELWERIQNGENVYTVLGGRAIRASDTILDRLASILGEQDWTTLKLKTEKNKEKKPATESINSRGGKRNMTRYNRNIRPVRESMNYRSYRKPIHEGYEYPLDETKFIATDATAGLSPYSLAITRLDDYNDAIYFVEVDYNSNTMSREHRAQLQSSDRYTSFVYNGKKYSLDDFVRCDSPWGIRGQRKLESRRNTRRASALREGARRPVAQSRRSGIRIKEGYKKELAGPWELDIDYFDWQTFDNGDGTSTTRYTLCRPLTDEQISKLSKYSNVSYKKDGAQYRYAPEIRHDTLYITLSNDDEECVTEGLKRRHCTQSNRRPIRENKGGSRNYTSRNSKVHEKRCDEALGSTKFYVFTDFNDYEPKDKEAKKIWDGIKKAGKLDTLEYNLAQEMKDEGATPENIDWFLTHSDAYKWAGVNKSSKTANATESLDEALKVTIGFESYEPWGGAKAAYEEIEEAGKLEDLEAVLEELYPDGIEETELNDLLWFSDDEVYDWIGMYGTYIDYAGAMGKIYKALQEIDSSDINIECESLDNSYEYLKSISIELLGDNTTQQETTQKVQDICAQFSDSVDVDIDGKWIEITASSQNEGLKSRKARRPIKENRGNTLNRRPASRPTHPTKHINEDIAVADDFDVDEEEDEYNTYATDKPIRRAQARFQRSNGYDAKAMRYNRKPRNWSELDEDKEGADDSNGDKVPVYFGTYADARQAGETDQYRASAIANDEFAEALKQIMEENEDTHAYQYGIKFDAKKVADEILKRFGRERVNAVLAYIVTTEDWDLRYSNKSRKWAATIPALPHCNDTSTLIIPEHPVLINEVIEKVIDAESGITEGKSADTTRVYRAYYHTTDGSKLSGEWTDYIGTDKDKAIEVAWNNRKCGKGYVYNVSYQDLPTSEVNGKSADELEGVYLDTGEWNDLDLDFLTEGKCETGCDKSACSKTSKNTAKKNKKATDNAKKDDDVTEGCDKVSEATVDSDVVDYGDEEEEDTDKEPLLETEPIDESVDTSVDVDSLSAMFEGFKKAKLDGDSRISTPVNVSFTETL